MASMRVAVMRDGASTGKPAGSSPPIASPSRYSRNWKGAASTSRSSQYNSPRGASAKPSPSRDSTRHSRAMSLAPSAIGPAGGRRNTAGCPSRTTK
ncbi:Uncharacterised protein [Mycobacteroides abscessus subsp. abscessus]|nr:Uncharacterised protein [Mycobacteroides abscessus subsp. abscessus]